ncbi:MAG: CzcE family metal-binding protein [Thiomonas sp.]
MNKLPAFLAVAGLAAAVSAHAAIPSWLYGNNVPDSAASRVIQLTPNTDNVNVKWGQSVEFKDHGKSFAFDFNGSRAAARVNLERVAPAGVINHPVYAYVRGFPEND